MNKLKTPTISRKSRRAVGDMPLRNDLILDHNVFTSIVHNESPGSILSLLGFGFGQNYMLGDNKDPMFEIRTEGLAANFIKVKEIRERREPLYVKGNSSVPDTIQANQPFQVTLDRAVLDSDENFLCRDQLAFGTVVSKRAGFGGHTDYTIRINGIPGETFNGTHLFEIDAPINYGYGNTQGEGSEKSNTLPLDVEESDIFFNPMTIKRYKTSETGDFISDEMYTLTQTAMDGSSEMEYNTGIYRKFFRQVLRSLEHEILFSRANFNPATFEILGRNTNSAYPERPTFAGIYQQLDQSNFVWTHKMRSSHIEGLRKIERIMQTLYYQPGSTRTYFAMCYGNGAQWFRDVLREGALATSPIRINVSPDANDAITVGFKIEKYVCDFGQIYLYDIGKAMGTFDIGFDVKTYNGMKGSPRSNQIFIFNSTVENGGKPSKIAKLITKEGNLPGRARVNRGFVFASSKGITGEGNGMTGEQLRNLQNESIDNMISNAGRYTVNSLRDGNEYHFLSESVPYIDYRGVCRMDLY